MDRIEAGVGGRACAEKLKAALKENTNLLHDAIEKVETGDSEKMSVVFGLMCFSMLDTSVKSMKSNSMPMSVNMVRHARLVPP